MNILKKIRIIAILVLFVMLMVPFNYSTTANPSECPAGRCEQLKAKLKRMETNPDNLSKKEFLKRVRAACNEMRKRKCPSLKNYDPNICFTDF